MSAWGAGAMTVERHVSARIPQADLGTAANAAERARGTPAKAPGIDTLITWIPGEVIAAYSAVVLAFQPEVEEGAATPPIEITALGWLLGGTVLAALLTGLGAWSKTDALSAKETREALARVVFSALAFAIWSFVVPGSWWYSQDWVTENAAVIPVVAGVVGLVFALLAEGTVRRIGK